MGRWKMQKKEKGKKMGMVIKIAVGVVIVAIISILAISGRNMKAMNSCVDAVLKALEEDYTVTRLDAGEFSQMKLFGVMKFDVEQYHLEQLGNLSVMRVNMGLMQMATVVITPEDKNMPLLSADYMYILGNRKCYLEFYDVVQGQDAQYTQLLDNLSALKETYGYLENIEVSPAWYQHLLTVTTYKAGKTNADQDLENMLVDNLHVYTAHARQLPELNKKEKEIKKAITLEYTDGLIEKGGISTDVFKKALGDEKTKAFFDQVFFGTIRQ